jgi:hypothetical protein
VGMEKCSDSDHRNRPAIFILQENSIVLNL